MAKHILMTTHNIQVIERIFPPSYDTCAAGIKLYELRSLSALGGSGNLFHFQSEITLRYKLLLTVQHLLCSAQRWLASQRLCDLWWRQSPRLPLSRHVPAPRSLCQVNRGLRGDGSQQSDQAEPVAPSIRDSTCKEGRRSPWENVCSVRLTLDFVSRVPQDWHQLESGMIYGADSGLQGWTCHLLTFEREQLTSQPSLLQ